MDPGVPDPDPYAVPDAELDDREPASYSHLNPRKTRRRYGEQEATVRQLGLAFMAVGCALFVYAGVTLITLKRFAGDHPDAAVSLGVAGGITLCALMVGLCGVGLWLLKPAARITSAIAGVLLFVLCPCGTWLGIYALILLLSESSKTVFSDDYAEVIAATPRERPRPAGGTLLVLWTPAVFLIVSSVIGTWRLANLR